jgi:hypothetical protein
MAKLDKLRPVSPTAEECLRKASSLRQMASAMPPGESADRAIHMADVWEKKARSLAASASAKTFQSSIS